MVSPSRRSVSVALILLCFLTAGVKAGAETPRITAADLGLGPLIAPLRPDTLLHGIAGAMAAFFVSSAGASMYGQQLVQNYPLLLPAIGASAAIVAGIGKETVDSTGFGDPQWSDIVHTVVGGLIAAGVVAAIEHSGGGLTSSSRQAQLYAGLGFSFAVPIAAGLLDEVSLYLAKRRSKK